MSDGGTDAFTPTSVASAILEAYDALAQTAT
jgi:hypothetical protein